MATHSHKRETARRKPSAALIAAPLAVLATGAAVTIGVVGSDPPSDILAVDQSAVDQKFGLHGVSLGQRAGGELQRGKDAHGDADGTLNI